MDRWGSLPNEEFFAAAQVRDLALDVDGWDSLLNEEFFAVGLGREMVVDGRAPALNDKG